MHFGLYWRQTFVIFGLYLPPRRHGHNYPSANFCGYSYERKWLAVTRKKPHITYIRYFNWPRTGAWPVDWITAWYRRIPLHLPTGLCRRPPLTLCLQQAKTFPVLRVSGAFIPNLGCNKRPATQGKNAHCPPKCEKVPRRANHNPAHRFDAQLRLHELTKQSALPRPALCGCACGRPSRTPCGDRLCSRAASQPRV